MNLILNPTENQKREFQAKFGRRSMVERVVNPGDNEMYETLAIDSHLTSELRVFWESLSIPGIYYLGYCDKFTGVILEQKKI